jgi:hypothetical protein
LRRSAPLALLAAYLFCRAALGAALNPLYNGPDEGAHVEYVTTVAQGRPATGAEARQLPTYYALAAVPWRLTEGGTAVERSYAVRLLSAAAGVVTLLGTWWAARKVWPSDVWRPVLSALWLLAPGHLFLLASVSNDPLVSALSTLSFLAALHIWQVPAERIRWAMWAMWVLTSLAALAVKPTALPVVVGAAVAFGWRWRASLLATRARQAAFAALAFTAVTVNGYLALQPPTLSTFASLARFWPLAVLRAPVAYVQRGGAAESFRTWWYGYDYLVRWPVASEAALAVVCLLVLLVATFGLVVGGRRSAPGLAWACAAAQVVFVLGRYGFADVLQINMGGAAQAKAFFTGIAPLSLLGAAGLWSAAPQLKLGPRALALGLLGCLFVVDALSLALTTWFHYRWWQVGA